MRYLILLLLASAAWSQTQQDTDQLSTTNVTRVCMMVFGADNASISLADADVAPQTKMCQLPYGTTITEIDVVADAGTPTMVIAKRHCTASPCASNYTVSNLVSASLSAASSGGPGCSKTGASTGIDGFTTCV